MEISSVTFFPRHTRITVRFRHHLYSSQVPRLARQLITMLPSLRDHACVNRKNLSFEEELTDTELGHVFEHLMLAILHRRGLAVRGQTTWNWQRDAIGTYQVTIGTGKKYLVKESLLIAQAVLTNALLGPLIRFTLPRVVAPAPREPMPLYHYRSLTPKRRRAAASRPPAQVLFAAAPDPLENSPSPGSFRNT